MSESNLPDWDHKKLGRELEIFCQDDQIGRGLPIWLPNGTVIRDELEKLMRELEFREGYDRVSTPHLARAELYRRTGHLPYYQEHVYPLMEVDPGEVYCLRPMNCPHHHRVFDSKPRSYRDLPVRFAEYGQVYRLEDSGALSGLLRVRGMCMNDAHIYCRPDQAKEEFAKVLELHREVYRILGISKFKLRLSKWDPNDPARSSKYVYAPEQWEWSQNLLREVLVELGLPFEESPGEAAFYGPKVDMQLVSALGREETASTNQLDFASGERLKLQYIGADGSEHVPMIIHRAPLGTHERFVAFLLEHFNGAFPTWLAPVQVRVLTVSDRFDNEARKFVESLRSRWIRAELDASNETLGRKIREAHRMKIPHLVVFGEKEASSGNVMWRERNRKEQVSVSQDEFGRQIAERISKRLLDHHG